MSELSSTCDKAVRNFLKAIQDVEEVKEEDVEAFKEDTDYCDNYISGLKQG